jgi:23S rRNA (cytosine1962-C5)-methyltransferase
MKSVVLKRGEDKRLRAGHPWIFSNEIKSSLKEHEPGDLVRVEGAGGHSLGIGYVNPQSLIAVRLLATGVDQIEDNFLETRIAAALGQREALYKGSTVYRVVYGESDALPGLIIDRYDDAVAVQILTAGMEKIQSAVLDAIHQILKPKVVVARNDTRYRELEGLEGGVALLHGTWNGPAWVSLEGIALAADLLDGQKTGLFLDQRDNLDSLAPWSPGARVLDCFCYTGAWGLSALRAGAASVSAVDSSSKALEGGRANAERNGTASKWTPFKGDAFEVLDSFREGPKFDLVILDPPSFVRRKDRLAAAKRRYREINLKAMALLRPGGVLVSCSCSYHLDRPSFKQLINEAATKLGRRAVLLEERGQSKDHPVLLAARETDYLKCFVLRIL